MGVREGRGAGAICGREWCGLAGLFCGAHRDLRLEEVEDGAAVAHDEEVAVVLHVGERVLVRVGEREVEAVDDHLRTNVEVLVRVRLLHRRTGHGVRAKQAPVTTDPL